MTISADLIETAWQDFARRTEGNYPKGVLKSDFEDVAAKMLAAAYRESSSALSPIYAIDAGIDAKGRFTAGGCAIDAYHPKGEFVQDVIGGGSTTLKDWF